MLVCWFTGEVFECTFYVDTICLWQNNQTKGKLQNVVWCSSKLKLCIVGVHYDGLLNEAVEKIIHLCVDIISLSTYQHFLASKAES